MTAGLLAVLAACSGSSAPPVEDIPPVGAGRCPLSVTPGSGPIAWTINAAEGWIDADPVSVGDGFLVGGNRCIGFVELSGRVRWTIAGILDGAARVDDIVVVAGAGHHSVAGVRATTGDVVWSRSDRGRWRAVAVQGNVVMLAGHSFDGSVVTLDAATGRNLATGLHPSTADGVFDTAIADDGLLLTAGGGGRSGVPGRRGPVVAADSSGRIVLDVSSGLFHPDPVGVAGDIVVVQASGAGTADGDGEPRTHLVGLDRASGAERWRRLMPGTAAGHALETGGMVVIRLPATLAGVDARSGVVRWSVPVEEDHEAPLAVVGPDAVAVGGQDGTVAVIDVADGRRRWTTRTEGSVAVLGTLGDVLFAANDPNVYRALRVSDGTPLWTARGPDVGAGSSRGGRRARLSYINEAAVTTASLKDVVVLRRSP